MSPTQIRRRDFLKISSSIATAAAMNLSAFAKTPETIDAAWYKQHRRFADLPMSRVAYVERGSGPAALFVHGYPLNGYQWRGALERLHAHRRCIAPDVMGLGFTQTPEKQEITPLTQVTMLGTLLDTLHVDSVDLVANASAQACITLAFGIGKSFKTQLQGHTAASQIVMPVVRIDGRVGTCEGRRVRGRRTRPRGGRARGGVRRPAPNNLSPVT